MRYSWINQARAAAIRAICAILSVAACTAPALATTKGLNQIVTPDIQPAGLLSVSVQQEDPNIGNRCQVQLEQGITKQFEIAYFHGFSPPVEVLNAELGMLQRPPYLLSTGFLGWTSNGISPQPFLEAGYYRGNWETVVGILRAESQGPAVGGSTQMQWETDALAGAAYRASPRLLLQLDYQAGAANYSTAGITYSITPQLSLNPAVYISNSTPHKGYGYAVLSWSIQAFK